MFDSPYCRIVATGHPETIVSFSAIQCPPGKFFTSRIFTGIPQNVVFLNCPGNAWYLDGIPGLGSSIEEAAAGLRSVLEQLGISATRKTFWGGSMGGFGAVLYGALCDADIIVATGAELTLLVAGGNTELILKQRQGRSQFPELHLESRVCDSKGRYFLYCGEFAYHDLVSAKSIMSLPMVRVGTLRDFGHALPGYLEEVYGLTEFLAAHHSVDTTFAFTRGETGLLSRHADWWDDLHAVSMGTSSAAEQRVQLGLAANDCIPTDLAAHCGYALSKGASLRGDYQAAVRYAEQSIQISGTGRYPVYRLVCALREAGVPVNYWLNHAMNIPDLADPNRLEFGDSLVQMIANGLLSSGNLRGARKFVTNQSKLSARHPKRMEILGNIFPKSEEDQTWRFEFTPACRESFLRLLLDRSEDLSNKRRILITGLILADRPEERIAEIFLKDNVGSIISFSMDLDSPGLAKLYPALPHARHSRFKIEIQLSQSAVDTLTICGKSSTGAMIDWLTIYRSARPISA